MFKITDKGVETQKIVEIQGQLENQPPLQEDVNEYPLQQNENEEQEEDEHEEEQNQQPLREISPQNLSIRRSTRPLRPSQSYPLSQYILLIDVVEHSCF